MHIIRSLNVVLTFVCSCFHEDDDDVEKEEEWEKREKVEEQRPKHCCRHITSHLSRAWAYCSHNSHTRTRTRLLHGAPQIGFFMWWCARKEICKDKLEEKRKRRIAWERARKSERKYKMKHESARCHAIVHRQIMLYNTEWHKPNDKVYAYYAFLSSSVFFTLCLFAQFLSRVIFGIFFWIFFSFSFHFACSSYSLLIHLMCIVYTVPSFWCATFRCFPLNRLQCIDIETNETYVQ